MDIAMITCSSFPQLSSDDALLLPALATRGITARPLIWNDPAVDWSQPVMSVLRSPWDYHHQRNAFLDWAERVSQLHPLWNPLKLLSWNTHKGYLLDLEHQGISIIPTQLQTQGTTINLATLMQEQNWSEVVIKPAVSASAFETLHVKEETLAQGQQLLERMLATHDMLIQPFFPTVISPGERSLICIDGEITHAVRRQPALAAKQDASILQEALVIAQEDEYRFAQNILAQLPVAPLYARIDIIRDENNRLYLMELELVEPGLWLEFAPHAVERFADAIASKLQ
ncbi:hypothetical protein KDW_44960 [Dictyobacter vulcani]|uniref:ATP-grasp domain-containing protein n=1 Tax=Dictyobacter vulcani TaxID=2607529 RepID=A0A5J4KLM2_9CHLR|nr:hypothetical protein [Dictyobacter vulcani]GER90334.1 hypothetical protein KDW_44960 [Dictyobacter vulcani]